MIKKTDLVEKYFEYVSNLIEKGRYQQAVSFLKKIKSINPAEPRIYKELGLMNFHRGKFFEAISNFQKALELNKDDYEVYYRMGCAYYYSGQIDTAIKFFEKTIELAPKFPQAYYNIGLAYEIKRDNYKAFEYMQKASKLSPDVEEITLTPKFLDKKAKEITIDEIKESLKTTLLEFINLKKKDLLAKLAFLKKNKDEKFKIYFQQGLKLKEQEKLEEALLYFEKAKQIKSDNKQVFLEKAKILYLLGNIKDAQDIIKEILEKDEKNIEANYYLGCISQHQGLTERAISIFKKVISISPTYAQAYYNLALCYEKLGDNKSYIQAMEKSAALNPQVKDLIPQVRSKNILEPKQKIKRYTEKSFIFGTIHFLFLAFLNFFMYLLDYLIDFLYAKEKYEKIYEILKRLKNKLKQVISKIE